MHIPGDFVKLSDQRRQITIDLFGPGDWVNLLATLQRFIQRSQAAAKLFQSSEQIPLDSFGGQVPLARLGARQHAG